MTTPSRRALLLGGASVLALAACGAIPMTPAQIIADAGGLVTALQKDLPLIVAADPDLMTPAKQSEVNADLAKAEVLAATVSAALPAAQGASTLQTVEGYVNVALDGLSAVATAADASPLAPFALPIQAAIVLAGVIETFVNSTLNTGAQTASARAKAVAPAMTPETARVILGVRTVG